LIRLGILISFVFCGCIGLNYTRSLSKEVKTGFTNRFEGHNTGLSKKINITGIYRYWNKDELGRPEVIHNTNDTAFVDMIFYEDGTFDWNLWIPSGCKNYKQYFSSVICKGKKALFYISHYWGIYSIAGDTIKTQYLMHASPGTPWYTGESWFLIKDPTTLQVIYLNDFDKGNNGNLNRHGNYMQQASLVKFIPQEHIPPPLSWIKNESFFWRNEQDRQQYLKSIVAKSH
jgi:hypothetical protein